MLQRANVTAEDAVTHRKHFVLLDGLRGVAAFVVAAHHASLGIMKHGELREAYLAVDFFFCLSGFVVAYAYDGRLRSHMAFKSFAVQRFIRLYPMIFIAALLGTAVALWWPQASIAATLAMGVGSFFLLPLGFAFHLQAYPVNNPLWSLFFELAANAAYGAMAWLRTSRWTIATAAAGVILVALTIHAGSVIAFGFNTPSKFLIGFARVAFPFAAGVLLFRFRIHQRGWAVPAVLPAALLLFILLAAPTRTLWFEVLSIVVLIPATVALGANAVTSRLDPAFVLLGELSFPFYVLHGPVINAAEQVPVGDRGGQLIVSAFAILVAGALAWVASRSYDRPLRKWLTAKL